MIDKRYTEYHAVMVDETGCEFGAGISAQSRTEAYDLLREFYPESKCVQLESPDDAREREARLYHSIMAEMDGDEDWDD